MLLWVVNGNTDIYLQEFLCHYSTTVGFDFFFEWQTLRSAGVVQHGAVLSEADSPDLA